ncbi:MAG: vWA domain-containing protein, partial [Lutibacter sp.]
MKKNVKIDNNYFLTTQVIENSVTTEVIKSTNHIVIIDVSGSMSYDLQMIRTQLKNKLSTLMKEGDTISIVWFSGRNDCGILKEEVEVRSLKTLADLNNAIDKWLRPIGLTAFLKPLQLTKQIIERIRVNRPDSVFSLIFLTDGFNNDSPWNEVISTLKSMESELAASTFVEYGYYADSQKLTQMAGVLGGEKISASNFDEYDPIFSRKISTPLMSGKKTVVDITDPYLYDFAFSVSDDGAIILYNIENGKIMVGGDVKEVHFFSPKAIGTEHTPETALYAAIYVLADKLLNDDAEKIFYALGDNFYYQELQKAFGKQKLNAFKSAIKECVADVSKRYPSGKAAIQKV